MTTKNAASTEMKSAARAKIEALAPCAVSQNQHLVAECAARCTDEKSTADTLRIMTQFCEAVAVADFAIDNTHRITGRNQKAIEKATKILRMFRTGVIERSSLDKYSEILLHNAKNHKGVLDTRQQNASLCAAIELDTMRVKDKRLHVAPSTASTQRSSSCYALSAVGLASYDPKSCKIAIDAEGENFKRYAACK